MIEINSGRYMSRITRIKRLITTFYSSGKVCTGFLHIQSSKSFKRFTLFVFVVLFVGSGADCLFEYHLFKSSILAISPSSSCRKISAVLKPGKYCSKRCAQLSVNVCRYCRKAFCFFCCCNYHSKTLLRVLY